MFFFSFRIIKYFDNGIAHRLHKNSWPLRKKPSDSSKVFYQVTLDQVLQIHLILWFGIGLSAVIAVFEIIIYYRQKTSLMSDKAASTSDKLKYKLNNRFM